MVQLSYADLSEIPLWSDSSETTLQENGQEIKDIVVIIADGWAVKVCLRPSQSKAN